MLFYLYIKIKCFKNCSNFEEANLYRVKMHKVTDYWLYIIMYVILTRIDCFRPSTVVIINVYQNINPTKVLRNSTTGRYNNIFYDGSTI